MDEKLSFENFLSMDEGDLEEFSRKHSLSFLPGETLVVQNHLKSQLPRYRAEKTGVTSELIELSLEVTGQSWCEHSAHGTGNGNITLMDYSGPKLRKVTYKNMLNDTIMDATRKLNKPWLIMAFEDDAGVIEFVTHNGKRYGFAGKCETHNYPSGVGPYGGSGTGLGGVIRDPYGVYADVRLASFLPVLPPPDTPLEFVGEDRKLPWIYMTEINRGNQVYGNDMGIPTVLAASVFSRANVNNPLVFCGAFGLLDLDYYEQTLREGVKPGDIVMLIGGRTGRDGMHGATLSSVGRKADESQEALESGVQIPNPIEEQSWSYFLVEDLFRKRIVKYSQDFGGGGLSSYAFEIGKKTNGIDIHIDNIRTKEAGMTNPEKVISESQERHGVVVDPANVAYIVNIFESHGIDAYPIGILTDTGRARIYNNETDKKVVMDMDLNFLHGGKPKVKRTVTFHVKDLPEPSIIVSPSHDLTDELKRVLSDYTVCSKEEPQIRIFDHQVQGSTVIPLLTGPNFDGPNDAIVYRPIPDCNAGFVVSYDTDVRKSMKHFGLAVRAIVDNAVRKNVIHGGDPDRMTIFDNWCMANCKGDDEDLGRLAIGFEAFRDCMYELDLPCDVGKDSMNNHFEDKKTGRLFYIAPTLLSHCRSVIPDVRTAVTSFAKRPGNLVYAVGITKPELGGSILHWIQDSSGEEEPPAGHDYYYISGYVGNDLPVIDLMQAGKMYRDLHKVITTGIYPKEKVIRAGKAISHGGIGVAVAQMAFGGCLGMELHLANLPAESKMEDQEALFSESLGRVLLEVPPDKKSQFEERMGKYSMAQVGVVTDSPELTIYGRNDKRVVYGNIEEFREAWKAPLRGWK